jgi:hypothetical protein
METTYEWEEADSGTRMKLRNRVRRQASPALLRPSCRLQCGEPIKKI